MWIIQSRNLPVDVARGHRSSANQRHLSPTYFFQCRDPDIALRGEHHKLPFVAWLAAGLYTVIHHVHGATKCGKRVGLINYFTSSAAIFCRLNFVWPAIRWHGFRPAHITFTAELEAKSSATSSWSCPLLREVFNFVGHRRAWPSGPSQGAQLSSPLLHILEFQQSCAPVCLEMFISHCIHSVNDLLVPYTNSGMYETVCMSPGLAAVSLPSVCRFIVPFFLLYLPVYVAVGDMHSGMPALRASVSNSADVERYIEVVEFFSQAAGSCWITFALRNI